MHDISNKFIERVLVLIHHGKKQTCCNITEALYC